MSYQDTVEAMRRRAQGEELVLPSGIKLRCRPAELSMLLLRGILPRNLISLASSGLAEVAEQSEADLLKLIESGDIIDKMAEMYQSSNHIIVYGVVDPKVVIDNPNYDAGEIGVEDFSPEERNAVLAFIQRDVSQWNTFRNPDGEYVQPVEGSESD